MLGPGRAHRKASTPEVHQFMRQSGFTLVELLIAFALAAMLMVGLNGVIGQALTIQDAVSEKNDLTRQARFAMAQMTRGVSRSRYLLLPSPENPATSWRESVREYPPQNPGETAVLAFFLDPAQDLDVDNFADADNDRDGKIDEDPGGDSNNDLASGIVGIDDDNDGTVDEQQTLIWPGANLGPANEDDDEDGYANEDLVNGVDDDGDGKLDEDIKKQLDGDDLAGIGGFDDDGDGDIDEGDKNDDDEDGAVNEDWYDTVVFYLDNGTLMQRTPVPWDEDSSGSINGLDFIVEPVAENVSHFRLERMPQGSNRQQIIEITLELTDPESGASVRLNTRIRVGGAL